MVECLLPKQKTRVRFSVAAFQPNLTTQIPNNKTFKEAFFNIDMKKRALNPVVTIVLLIAIAVVLAVIIFLSSKKFMTELSPPPDEFCRGLDADAYYEILYTDANQFNISIVNKGNGNIAGVIIKEEKNEGETINREVVSLSVSPGATETKTLSYLTVSDKGKEFLVVPKVALENDDILTCPNEFGKLAKTLKV